MPMNVVKYSKYENKPLLLDYLQNCDWQAGKFLFKLLETKSLYDNLGLCEILFLLDGENVVGFLTLSEKDCIDDLSLCPWIGFVYVALPYRGHRYSKILIDFASAMAKENGAKRVYLATDHIGLYEKYGFVYFDKRRDVWGEYDTVFYREL